MNFIKRLKLYLFGFSIGLIFVIFIFREKVFSWSYFPNDRVLNEIKSKPIKFSTQSLEYIKQKKITKEYILNTALKDGNIDFKSSNAQATPCPNYFLKYKDLDIYFTKCQKIVTIDSIR